MIEMVDLFDKAGDYLVSLIVPKEEVEEKNEPDLDQNTMQAEPRAFGTTKTKIGF